MLNKTPGWIPLTKPPRIGDVIMFNEDFLDTIGESGLFFNRRKDKLKVFDVYVSHYLYISLSEVFVVSSTNQYSEVVPDVAIYANGIGSGAFGSLLFIPIFVGKDREVSINLVSEPRNNDGNSTCFWCKVPTEKRGGGMYDICPKCGK